VIVLNTSPSYDAVLILLVICFSLDETVAHCAAMVCAPCIMVCCGVCSQYKALGVLTSDQDTQCLHGFLD
jgi:hypothetical protein